MENIQHVRIGEIMVPAIFTRGVITAFLDENNWDEGLKTIANYVSDLFGRPIHRITVGWETRWMIDWINERQTVRLNEAFFACPNIGVNPTNEEYQRVIDRLTPTRSLTLIAMPTIEGPVGFQQNEFRYTGTFHDVDRISFLCGWGVTRQTLMELNSISIEVSMSSLTHFDMNAFIRHWLAGGSPRLKYIKMMSGNNFEPLLEGLADRVVENRRVRRYKKPSGEIQQIRNGYDIIRDDGVVATIDKGVMVVWPDLDDS